VSGIPAEGWGAIRRGDHRSHYYRDGFSVCRRRIGPYVHGPLERDFNKTKDNCLACCEALDREHAASRLPGTGPGGLTGN